MIPTSTIGGPMEFTLRLIGVWPDSSCRYLMRVVWTMAMVASQFLQYWYLFAHIGSDTLPNLMDSMSLCLSNSLLFLKLSLLWLNGRIIYDILTMMAEDWNECASTRSKLQPMVNKAILSHRFSKCSIGAYTIVLLLFGASDVIAQKSAGSEQLVEEKRFIVKMKLPSKCSASPFYEIVMLTQFLLQFTSAIVAGMLNALMVTFILHIAGQIDVMCHELLEIPVAEDRRDSRIVALRSVVNRHQRIIALADNIEDVFCYMALMQFLSNTFVICFLGFVIVTSLNSPDIVMMKILPYYAVVNLEAFILCYSGEYLSSKSKTINRAAYNSFWYELKPTESKILFLLILRSQKELAITAGKFIDLSLEGFTSILKASASYVSVLHAMY
ncbi:odorant receptor 10-like [Temnothorax longispinosus]|uniref:odorant receptor 10-like n=1 Tax=Temnothorax longispinosus TaxID=300112 RepID=UPI003A99C5C9